MRNRALLVPALLAAALMLAAPAAAQTAGGGFGAAPSHSDPADPATRAYFKPVIAPGAAYQDSVLVTNSSDDATTLIVYPVDGLTGQTSGTVYANHSDPLKKAGMWLSPSMSTVTLAPHAGQLVPFKIVVPAGASSGDHVAGIAVEAAERASSGGEFGVKTVLRTVVGVDITVPGPAAPGLAIGRLALRSTPGTDMAALSMRIGDPGGKLVKPFVTVTMNGPDGYHRTVQRQLDTVLPGDSIDFPFAWPDSLRAGDYHATVQATGGAIPVTRSADLTLGTALRGVTNRELPTENHFPWTPVVAGVGILVLASMLWWWARRRRARERAARRARRSAGLGARPTPRDAVVNRWARRGGHRCGVR
jgi:hypothetical protein